MKREFDFSIVKPNVVSAGFALFFASNATGVWGGVFPFLPMFIQTDYAMIWFYFAVSTALFFTFIFNICYIYFGFRILPTRHILWASACNFLGWSCLIAGMYVVKYLFALLIAGGVLLGSSSASFYLLWQRVFANSPVEQGSRDVLMGFAYATLIYFALYLLPRAVIAFLVPLVFLPLYALALILSSRKIELSQPMFSDSPRDHWSVYKHALSKMWRSALGVGALGFCTGMMRSIAIENPGIGVLVNALSMSALLIASLILFSLWRLRGVRFNVYRLYSGFFPVVITLFVLLPFASSRYTNMIAAVLFALFTVSLLFVMLSCAQVSRDRGIHPFLAFGVYAAFMFALHSFGYIIAGFLYSMPVLGSSSLSISAVASIYLLALMYFVNTATVKRDVIQSLSGDSLELVVPIRPRDDKERQNSNIEKISMRKREDTAYKDRLSKQVSCLHDQYLLSDREVEVADLVVRGNTVSSVAEQLYISENTVRTHMKRIYAKLDIHKKQDLIDLVNSF